jgi:hypothetical protein
MMRGDVGEFMRSKALARSGGRRVAFIDVGQDPKTHGEAY